MTTEKRFTLNTQQRNILKKGFWSDYEIRQFTLAKAPDGVTLQDFKFNSATFLQARANRENWAKELKTRGWSRKEILGRIDHFYSLRSGRSPFDFIKESYKPPKGITRYADAIRRTIRARIDRSLGRGYGKRKLPETRRVHLAAFPKRPKRPVRRKLGPRLPIRRGPSNS